MLTFADKHTAFENIIVNYGKVWREKNARHYLVHTFPQGKITSTKLFLINVPVICSSESFSAKAMYHSSPLSSPHKFS